MPLVSVLDYASNSGPHHFLQAQMQPQWQAQEPSNEDVKVRNPMALERQKGLQEGFFVVVFFFSQPELGFTQSLPFIKIGMAGMVSMQ